MAASGCLALLLALLVADSLSAHLPWKRSVPGGICEPGSTLMVGCNRCQCGYDGRPTNCRGGHCSREDPPPFEFCQPRQTFKIECNTCHCGNDGMPESCTKHKCEPRKFGTVPLISNKPSSGIASGEILK